MSTKKIGLFFGVFVPNVTMMFGVILFLRLGVVVAHTGPLTGLLVVLFGLIIMLITSASIASIVSNMEIGAGGVYYIVTRSLGLEIGGALGYAIYLSQLLSIALTTSGFAYTFIEIFPQFNLIPVEIVTLATLTLLSSTSAKFALKCQGIILAVLLAAIGTIFLGDTAHLPATTSTTPFYEGGHLGFWMGFALLYPALTGIEAGMALSGNLKNPSRSLAWGNALSLIFVAGCYAALMSFAFYAIPLDILKSDPFAFVYFAQSSALVKIGICAATLSSALGSLLGAPRILQSIANDGLIHRSLAKTYGQHQEPRWALLLTMALALIITVSTNIDQIIPILTMICLVSYGLLNVIAMLSSLMNAPSWRPRFKVHFLISLLGALLCLIGMFMISAGWAFAAIFLLVGFYLALRCFELNAKFSDIRNSILFFLSRVALYRLAKTINHAQTWHPILLVLIKSAPRHKALAQLASSFTQQSGLLSFGSVVPESWSDPNKINATQSALAAYYEKENIACLVDVHTAEDENSGYVNLIKSYGIGQIQPNTVVLPINAEPFKEAWLDCIYQCYLTQKNMLLYQEQDVLDQSESTEHLSSRLKNAKGKLYLDIWWVSSARASFDLLVSLACTLKDDPQWSSTKVRLHAMTSSRKEQQAMKQFLNSFVKKSRLRIEVKVYRDQNSTSEYSGIKLRSKENNLTFIPIVPMTEEVSFKDYADYMNTLFLATKDLSGPILYVSSYDNIEHQENYHYPITSDKT